MADTPQQEMSEEEKMAAEWAAGEGDAATARVLSQNEIDSLLGFGDGNAGDQENSGIMALINSALNLDTHTGPAAQRSQTDDLPSEY